MTPPPKKKKAVHITNSFKAVHVKQLSGISKNLCPALAIFYQTQVALIED